MKHETIATFARSNRRGLKMTTKRQELPDYDITGQIGDSLPRTDQPEWPMYSFRGPSMLLWNAIGRRLAESGWSETKVREWLQSKEARWALDGSLGIAIEALGATYAEKVLAERR
jgi:hypothetical protein